MADYRGSTTQTDTRDMTQTPLWLFRALDLEFNFSLDAAALPETALCQKYLTPDIDALNVDWGDFISPSFYLLGLVELLIGLDPIDWVAKAVVGDYRVISEVGDAILALSEFTAQQADLMATDAGIMFNC